LSSFIWLRRNRKRLIWLFRMLFILRLALIRFDWVRKSRKI